jgi:hypothetical protein
MGPLLLAASLVFGADPQLLDNARRLADELRFEEAVVEYQRYLSRGPHPTSQHAQALLELGFLHLVLGDEPSARIRAMEALEMEPTLKLPPDAPTKQVRFLEQMRQQLDLKVRVEVLPREPDDPQDLVRARVSDKRVQVHRMILRHGLTRNGPFYAAPMRCRKDECTGVIPPPRTSGSYSAWYYVEAQDGEGNTLALGRGPGDPLQVSIVRSTAWYKSPWVWGGTAAVVLTVGIVVFLVSPQPAR